ncbi:Actin-related protein 4 [Ceratocystis lukuohia]|uniref:Actin-related protein 4 n=2 Tax=Ceratocystis TaxID=5157 RepID=A0A0F8B518_CERFI|nr:Actin-related protein 4 [Ceratocystis platani]
MAHQQTFTSANAPTDVYGGDEAFALVIDPGFSNTCGGFAGRDRPDIVIPSSYADYESGQSKYGDEFLHPYEGLRVRNYMSHDGVVENWDAARNLLGNVVIDRLQPSLRSSLKKPSPAAASQPPEKGKEKEVVDGADNGASASAPADGDGDISMGETSADAATATNAAATENAEAAAEAAELSEKPLAENPLLLTEAPWNTPKAREKAMEIIMEDWGCPAFWFGKTPALVAFAAGKATALVIDVGASGTSVTAVHDGMVLKRSITRSPVGGLWLSHQVRNMFATSESAVDLTPTFMVESKTAVDAGSTAQFTPRNFSFAIDPSFRAYEEERLLTDFKESVVEVWRGPAKLTAAGTEDAIRAQPGRVFEMPTGANQMWREQRYRVAEGMWDETAAYPAASTSAPDSTDAEAAYRVPLTKAQTIPELVRTAIAAVDTDLRPNLLANIVVTGGTTLLNGFSDRLQAELSTIFPGVRIRLHAAGLSSERRFGAWIGGSILASLGSFHQMWISKKEYEENGAAIVEKRCK